MNLRGNTYIFCDLTFFYVKSVKRFNHVAVLHFGMHMWFGETVVVL